MSRNGQIKNRGPESGTGFTRTLPSTGDLIFPGQIANRRFFRSIRDFAHTCHKRPTETQYEHLSTINGEEWRYEPRSLSARFQPILAPPSRMDGTWITRNQDEFPAVSGSGLSQIASPSRDRRTDMRFHDILFQPALCQESYTRR